jgi:uncharacterized membrane protein YiaA
MRATFAAVYNSLPSLSADIEMQVEAAEAETEEQVCEVVPTPPAPTRASLLPATSERSDSTSFSAYPRPPRVSGQLTLSLEQDHVLSAQASKDMRRAVGQSWLTNRFGYPPKGNQQAKLVGQWAEERFLQHTASHQLGYVRRRFFGFSLMLLASYIYAQTRIYVDTVTGDSEFVHDEQNEKLFSVATLLVGAWLIPRAQSRYQLVVSFVAILSYEVQLWGEPRGVEPESSLGRIYRLSELLMFTAVVCLNGCLDYLPCALVCNAAWASFSACEILTALREPAGRTAYQSLLDAFDNIFAGFVAVVMFLYGARRTNRFEREIFLQHTLLSEDVRAAGAEAPA